MSCKALPCTVKSLYVIRSCGAESHANEFFEIFFPRSRKTSDERRSNRLGGRSEDAQSDAEIGKKMKKKSSLTSLRKDNEGKLEDEIN